MTPKNDLDLTRFKFSAAIDYVSLRGIEKEALPQLDGKAQWPKSHHGRLTIHDPTAGDIGAVSDAFPCCVIEELEVCVDVFTAQRLPSGEQDQLLQSFKTECVSKQLLPKFSSGMNSGFRGAYDPVLDKTGGFNHRVPDAREQLLYGHRADPVQVKCYYKRTDRRRSLAVADHCIRIEVRIGPVGLGHHGLTKASDLIGFKFRKELMGYFNHTCGSRLPRIHEGRRSTLLSLMYEWSDKQAHLHWSETGVGMHVQGGKRYQFGLLYKRNTKLNNRIGQALGRLEQSLSEKKFVRKPSLSQS